MKKSLFFVLSLLCVTLLFTGCSSEKDVSTGSSFNKDTDINVVSREDGSGTRGAFVELFGIEVKGDDGKKKDMTTKEAVIAKQTDVMMTNIAGDKYAIGYISLGSLNDTVKAVTIDGVEASIDNVKKGSYSISRPFNIATKGDTSPLIKDFISFILSKEGQTIVSNSYIAINDGATSYSTSKVSGKIVVAGSSSVTPVMEKLKEAYVKLNPDVNIEIQQSDSTAGMVGAVDGTCDIGMASRQLKQSELDKLTPTVIALDGIAVIVNKENIVENITKEQIKDIFTGATTKWSNIIK